MKNLRNLMILLFVVLTFLQSCKKDEEDKDICNGPFESGVYVINEGNFSQGNSSISYYSTVTSEVCRDIFARKNNRPLGDVAFDFVLDDETGYVTVNNSGKVEVVDVSTLESKASISGLGSPRYFLKVAANKAYVTDYSFNSTGISIVDLSNNAVSGQVPATGSTDGIAMSDGKVFVCNPGSKKVLIIDPSGDAVVNEITVPNGASTIAKDKDGNLWVLCTGDYLDSLPRHIVQMDVTGQMLKNLEISDVNAFLADMLISEDGSSIYFINYDVYKMSITDTQIPATPFITAGARSFYSLGWEPGTTNLYVGDAGNYSDPGQALIYDSNSGTMIKSFQTGISPGAFAFL